MLDVEQALGVILQRTVRRPAVALPLSRVLHHWLTEDITSDLDSPPYDKSLVDGYAVRSADMQPRATELVVLEEVTAGEVPSQSVASGTATRTMTGAPIPTGADAVVMVERTQQLTSDGRTIVRIESSPLSAGANIMRRGTSMRQGETVLRAGTLIRPIEVGLLAEVGRAHVRVLPKPRVAIITTGNELVACHEVPAAGQIRNSNGPMLGALVEGSGAELAGISHARDVEADLHRAITSGLEHDVLVLSGGVSAGVLDLVPELLRRCGVREVFHKVRLKPGKPLWFGIHGDEEMPGLVFGLPGNPVSSLVCFWLFVLPAIRALQGAPEPVPRRQRALLAQSHRQRGDRATYFPAVLVEEDGVGSSITPLPWRGSADLCTLARANALAHFPAGDRDYAAGDAVDALRL